MNESIKNKRKNIIEELENYSNNQDIICIDRDGDLFFVECPECHSTDLNTRRIISCRVCHTHFSCYVEDGLRILSILKADYGTIRSDDKIRFLSLEGGYFKHILYGRNDKKEILDEIKQKYPKLKIITLYRDLINGMDAHGHYKYKRYAIIPLD